MGKIGRDGKMDVGSLSLEEREANRAIVRGNVAEGKSSSSHPYNNTQREHSAHGCRSLARSKARPDFSNQPTGGQKAVGLTDPAPRKNEER